MSRPEHISAVNSAEGISRINAEQELYDKDPEAYEAQERAYADQRMQEAQYEAEQQAADQARYEAEQSAQQEYEQQEQSPF